MMMLPHLLSALFIVAGLTAGSASAGVLDAVKQAGILKVGLDYVPPTYRGGMKFRTPESLDSVLANDLAMQLSVNPSYLKNLDAGSAIPSLRGGKADVVLTLAPEPGVNVPAPASDTVIIPTGYTAGGMAIMRTDTTIRKWEDLKGRTVCVSEGSAYVGMLASRYGATEKVVRAPADSLLAVRVGDCDAAVHDDTLMKELLKLPEWKKFSAQLPPQRRAALVLKVRGADAADLAALREVVNVRWNNAWWAGIKKKWVNDVAFEVYLDQNVPDCH